MATETQLKKQALVTELQALGVDKVNPQASVPALEKMLAEAKGQTTSATVTVKKDTIVVKSEPASDTDKILAAIGGIAGRLDMVEKEVNRIKDKGVNDFKLDVQDADVTRAAANKSSMDQRIVKIVENTLGVDFGIEVESFPDKPGVLLHILVPKRLSPVSMMWRPVRDNESGKYKVDPKTQQVVEEEYWPGDKRSISMGVTSSYEMVQQHCNRIRAYIIKEYQKRNQPNPEFRIN